MKKIIQFVRTLHIWKIVAIEKENRQCELHNRWKMKKGNARQVQCVLHLAFSSTNSILHTVIFHFVRKFKVAFQFKTSDRVCSTSMSFSVNLILTNERKSYNTEEFSIQRFFCTWALSRIRSEWSAQNVMKQRIYFGFPQTHRSFSWCIMRVNREKKWFEIRFRS